MRDYVAEGVKCSNAVTVFTCRMQGYIDLKKTKEFTTSRWAYHIAIECQFAPAHVKERVAQAYKTKRVIQFQYDFNMGIILEIRLTSNQQLTFPRRIK